MLIDCLILCFCKKFKKKQKRKEGIMRTEGGNEWRETGKYGYLRTESMKYVKPLLFIAINKINIKNEKNKGKP